MAGHSKWANIRHRKGKQDEIRGKAFTRLAREIIVAARAGGADPSMNARLRVAIEKARAESVPKENIERAIKKGSGELEGEQFEELTYEGVAPGGVGVIVEVTTDNRNRTAADLRHAFTKAGGNLAESGAVAWQFKRVGQIVLQKNGQSEDELTLAALDAGAEDVEPTDDGLIVYTPVERLHAVNDHLSSEDLQTDDVALAYVPTTVANPEQGDLKRLVKLLGALDDLEDVQETFVNAEIPEQLLNED